MIIVTGGAGMIGSNIVAALNARGLDDILIVDHLKNGQKMHNLVDCNFRDYMDRDQFIDLVRSGLFSEKVSAIFHQGACSNTTEWDGKFLMDNNFAFSKDLLLWSLNNAVSFIYASSASVYGLGEAGFREVRASEKPINMYAFSKFQFDQYVRSFGDSFKSQVVGLRYFNVYGPREAHKGAMSSTQFHFNNQILKNGVANLFEGFDGYGDGEQKRDFVYVDDCVDVNLWFLDNSDKCGIFNVGSGEAREFNQVAGAVIKWHKNNGKDQCDLAYIKFPEHLKGVYQNYTQADISALRKVGYSQKFTPLEQGVYKYLDWLNKS
ncbi:ADP-glyceromanno-heptose 6-epimerase [Gammaproteobacteria bacterium]|nr:ADP-glyceromanno-heptose 6-epimerase [Gammaproteobacteria bacterium]